MPSKTRATAGPTSFASMTGPPAETTTARSGVDLDPGLATDGRFAARLPLASPFAPAVSRPVVPGRLRPRSPARRPTGDIAHGPARGAKRLRAGKRLAPRVGRCRQPAHRPGDGRDAAQRG